jgi:3-isopropylmalate/(R)-2-methylmalate dehydratase large subunit
MCNMTIEMGARSGFIAPDETIFSWLEGRPWAPAGRDWEAALAWWRTLRTDEDAAFDREIVIDCDGLEPQITWGIDPSHTVGISGRVPDPATADEARRGAMQKALAYMDLTPGTALEGLPINRVFVGSCTNARLPDLEAAAAVLRGRRVADGVIAMAVPGSSTVKRQAEEKGIDKIFKEAGFSWGESGCSMCAGGNGDRGQPGDRCVSTTNRNFENRQGVGVRTHLASPTMAAAAAVSGRITDVRRLLAGGG